MKSWFGWFAALLILLTGCKKANPTMPESKFCWQLTDASGNLLQKVCEKTEPEMKALYPNACSYYKDDGEKSCWLVGTTFLPSMTKEGAELYVRCFHLNGGSPVKVGCDYCQQWYHREKKTYKPAGSVTYSYVIKEQFCGDTATKLYQGRQIVLRETADSLIVLQFSNDGTNW